MMTLCVYDACTGRQARLEVVEAEVAKEEQRKAKAEAELKKGEREERRLKAREDALAVKYDR